MAEPQFYNSLPAQVISSSLLAFRPSLLPYKPVITFLLLAVLFLLDLVLATQGGIHVYHLLTTYIASWPALLFSLLTVLATVLCHGTSSLIRSMSCLTMLGCMFAGKREISIEKKHVLATRIIFSYFYTPPKLTPKLIALFRQNCSWCTSRKIYQILTWLKNSCNSNKLSRIPSIKALKGPRGKKHF